MQRIQMEWSSRNNILSSPCTELVQEGLRNISRKREGLLCEKIIEDKKQEVRIKVKIRIRTNYKFEFPKIVTEQEENIHQISFIINNLFLLDLNY